MGELIARVPVATNALEGAPDAGEAGEEAHGAQVGGVALRRLVPAAGVEAEEQGYVLHVVSKSGDVRVAIYLHSCCM